MHRLNHTDHSKLLKRKSRRVLQKQPVMLRIVNSWLSTKVPNTNDKWLKILMFSRVATLSDQPMKIISLNIILPALVWYVWHEGGMAYSMYPWDHALFKSLWWWTYIFFYVQSKYCMVCFFLYTSPIVFHCAVFFFSCWIKSLESNLFWGCYWYLLGRRILIILLLVHWYACQEIRNWDLWLRCS